MENNNLHPGRSSFDQFRRIVVKIGSSILEDNREQTIHGIARQIKSLHSRNCEIVLVTSGAIYFGVNQLQRASAPVTLPQKQATAAVGQPLLMSFYQEIFAEQKINTAQVLLTQDGIHNHQTYLNACNTMNALLDMNVLPIVNENDTVATEEIQFGNNDTLASLVTTMVDADLLVILSDVDGLYENGPDSEDAPIAEVPEINEHVRQMARPANQDRTTVGGMITKIEAAETVVNSGIPMVIADGNEQNVLPRILDGESIGTCFQANKTSPLRGRKRWISHHLPVKGSVSVDRGAADALVNRGKSLLPSGVKQVDGQFERGDAIDVVDPEGQHFARGLSNYSREEIESLRGCQTSEISDILGYHNFDEIIHRDNLVINPND